MQHTCISIHEILPHVHLLTDNRQDVSDSKYVSRLGNRLCIREVLTHEVL